MLMLNFFATKSGTKGWQIAKIALLRKLIPKNQMVTLKMLNWIWVCFTFWPTLLARRISFTFVVTFWVSSSWVRAAISYRLGALGMPPSPTTPPRFALDFCWEISFRCRARGSRIGGDRSWRDSWVNRKGLGNMSCMEGWKSGILPISCLGGSGTER